MLPKTTLTILMTTAITIGGISNAIAEEDNPLYLTLEVGAEYDDNITVDAVDITSQKGDSAALFDGSIAYDFVNENDTSFELGYGFSQSLYFDLSEFDLQIHSASLTASSEINDVDFSIAYLYNNISLGSESFLEMHSFQTSFTTLVGTKFLIIGGYEYQEQKFQQPLLLRRDGNRHSVNLKNYFLLGNGRTINVGYKLSRHNTLAAELVYWGHTFDIGFKLPVPVIDGAKFKTRYRYLQKNYSNIDPTLGEKRRDKRHAFRAGFEVPVTTQFTASLQYEYTDSKSNLIDLNYDNHLISFSVGWEL